MNRQTLVSVIVGIAMLPLIFMFLQYEGKQNQEQAKAGRARLQAQMDFFRTHPEWRLEDHPDWAKANPSGVKAWQIWQQERAGLAPIDSASVTSGASVAATGSGAPAGQTPAVAANASRAEFDARVAAQKDSIWALDTPTFVAELDATGGAVDTLTFKDIKEGSFKPTTSSDKKVLDSYQPLHVYGDPSVHDKKIRTLALTTSRTLEDGIDQLRWLHSELPKGGHRFERVLPDGDLVVTKDFIPGDQKDDYHLLLRVTVQNKGTVDHKFGYTLTGPAGLVEPTSSRPWGVEACMALRDSNRNIDLQKEPTVTIVDKKKPLQIQRSATEHRDISYFGLSTKYFAAVVLPQEATHPLDSVRTENLVDLAGHIPTSADEKAVAAREDSILKQVAPVGVLSEFLVPHGESATQEYYLFVGPRSSVMDDNEHHEVYAKAGLGKLNEYSSWIPGANQLAKLLTFVLHAFHALFFGSWAVAILALTLCVRGALHPVMVKQLRSSTKMQNLAPEMTKLKEKYTGKDGQMSPEASKRFQMEQWELYKKHGINPLGCAGPMFLQFPIFIGLYNALNQAYDLRQAGFLWIRDLSEPDVVARLPFNLPMHGMNALCILPILMLFVYVGQMRSMPKPADPQAAEQQKIMNWMMPFMGYMFYTMPSGLLLYYITSSTIGMLESRWIKRQLAAEQAQPQGFPVPATKA